MHKQLSKEYQDEKVTTLGQP